MVIPAISRLGFRADGNSMEFQAYCISLAKEIDSAIGKNEVPPNVQELAIMLNHVYLILSFLSFFKCGFFLWGLYVCVYPLWCCFCVKVCRRRCDAQTKAVLMVLMISAKSACELGWFPQKETQELLALADRLWNSFSSPENVIPSVNSPVTLIQQVIERFYPVVKLGHIVLSLEAKPESNILVKDFDISKKMPYSPKQKVGLFVVRIEDISKSSCIIHPQEVSFMLNGMAVEKRVRNSMDSGPQLPTNVIPLLNAGANLLQAIGCFGGSYVIVIAFMDVIPLPDKPLLKDYVHSEVIESNADCDIIEGSSRISLSCPISQTLIKHPVKGHVCKHLQCFDFWNYVNMNLRRPTWRCPHCNQSVCYTDIRVDQNMIKILEEVGCDAADVVISADGSWKVVTEIDENMELVPETTHDHEDPNSYLNLGPTVLDLTSDENGMETSGDQVHERKPCLSEIQGQSNNPHNPTTDYTMLNQPSASINALPQLPQTLNALDGQQFMNLPQVVNTQDSATSQALPTTVLPTSFPQDRLATNAASFRTTMPAAQSSQFQGSHVSSLGPCLGRTPDLMERWNHIYRDGINQTQFTPMPPLQHHYAMQSVPVRSMSPAQQRPMPSYTTHPQASAVNYGGTTDQRRMQRPNPGGAVEQFSSREFMNSTPANTANWRPQARMRGSLMPGSTGYEHMIIRPTRPVRTQAQTLPPPQPTAYNNSMADEVQAFLAHPSYPIGTNETQAGIGSLPVAEGVGSPGWFWSMLPETW